MPQKRVGDRKGKQAQNTSRKNRTPQGNENLKVGNPGNSGGGNVKNTIRQSSIITHANVLVQIQRKLKEGKYSISELCQIMDKVGKYGIGSKVEVSIENPEMVRMVVAVALKYVPEDKWEAFQSEIAVLVNQIAD